MTKEFTPRPIHAALSIAFTFVTTLGWAAQSDEYRRMTPKTPNEVRALAKTMRTADMNTRAKITGDLVNVSSAATNLQAVFMELLDDKDEDVQAAAAQVAAKMKLKQAIPKIRKFLAKQPRHRISEKLKIHTPEQARDLGHTRVAAIALIDLDDFDSVDEIISRDMFMMNMPGIYLAKFGAKVLPKVLQHAKDGEQQRGGARNTIGAIRDVAAVPQLLELLNGSDPLFATGAAEGLTGIINNPVSADLKAQIVAQLQSQFKNPDPRVREQVYSGLLAADSEATARQVFTQLQKESGYTQLVVLDSISGYRTRNLGVFLEEYIRQDEAQNPNDHGLRRAAAIALYRTTGTKIQYKGLEEDQARRYTDPYADRP